MLDGGVENAVAVEIVVQDTVAVEILHDHGVRRRTHAYGPRLYGDPRLVVIPEDGNPGVTLVGGYEIEIVVIVEISRGQEASLDIDGELNRPREEIPRNVQQDSDPPVSQYAVAQVGIPIAIEIGDDELSSVGLKHLALGKITAVEDHDVLFAGDGQVHGFIQVKIRHGEVSRTLQPGSDGRG